MTPKDHRLSAVVLSLAVGLSGCGSGGSDGDNRIVNGGSERTPGDGGGTNGAVALISGVDRLFVSGRTVPISEDGTTMVEETEGGGWNLTINGRSATLSDRDRGAHPTIGDDIYFKDLGADQTVVFWSIEGGGFDETPAPEFDNLNVYAFGHSDVVPGADVLSPSYTENDFVRSDYISIVTGIPTRDMLSTGSATYDGRMSAFEWARDTAVFSTDSTRYRGEFSMRAEFGTSGVDVSGEFFNLQRKVPGGRFASIPDIIEFATTVGGNRLSPSDLSIGSEVFGGYENIGMKAAFFGPAAAEVGGVFKGEKPNTLLHVWFAGAREE